MTYEEFLAASRISDEEWEASGASWDDLSAIADAYDARRAALTSSAQMLAGRLQLLEGVHSVRWRVKDTSHLLAKIVRKKLEKSAKYEAITAENYSEVIRDLVGVRALHLFKDDEVIIDEAIREGWTLAADEQVLLYYHASDEPSQAILARGAQPEKHIKGYRSNHYIIEMRPDKHKVFAEVQVRTIFAEGWSEIDHTVRYPNFVDDEQVDLFLAIFNSLAVNADWMGSFVKGLTVSLKTREDATVAALKERDDALEHMRVALGELKQVKEQNQTTTSAIAVLQEQYDHLQSQLGEEKQRREEEKKHSSLRGAATRTLLGGDTATLAGLTGLLNMPHIVRSSEARHYLDASGRIRRKKPAGSDGNG